LIALPSPGANALVFKPVEDRTSASYSDPTFAHAAFLPLYNQVNSFMTDGKNAATASSEIAFSAMPRYKFNFSVVNALEVAIWIIALPLLMLSTVWIADAA
jgi:hypothetical protein